MEPKLRYVLGAPGSGKTSVVPHLRRLLPRSVILDWDSLMEAAGALMAVDIREHEAAWVPYAALMRQVVEVIGPDRVIMLGVCTPEELPNWPPGDWLVLDCSDHVRASRLRERGEAEANIRSALEDATAYRNLDFATLDVTGLSTEDTAVAIAEIYGRS